MAVRRARVVCGQQSMILKDKDSLDGRIATLERALANAGAKGERQRLERDLAILRAGIKGEEEAAYLIDFELKDTPNWAVIHDLRLEWKGRVAQIDHLVLDRFLDAYVVESKNYRTKVRHANGGWERLAYNHWEGIPCPGEQNRRHILVLEEMVAALRLAPMRLGVPMGLAYINVVAVGSACSVVGEFPKGVRVMRMDQMVRQFRADDPSLLSAFKMISAETLQDFAANLVMEHKPAVAPAPMLREESPAYRVAAAPPVPVTATAPPPCESCGGALSSAEANFCRMSKARFAGKLLCRKCQGFAPKAEPQAKPNARCGHCGGEVDAKVVAFCRFSSKRFGGRVLCRNCQTAAA